MTGAAVIRTALARGIRVLACEIDARDLAFLAGLGMLGYGVALVSPPVAWAVVGAVVARVSWGRPVPVPARGPR